MDNSKLMLLLGILALIPVLGIIPIIYYLIKRKKIKEFCNKDNSSYKVGKILFSIGLIYNAIIVASLFVFILGDLVNMYKNSNI